MVKNDKYLNYSVVALMQEYGAPLYCVDLKGAFW